MAACSSPHASASGRAVAGSAGNGAASGPAGGSAAATAAPAIDATSYLARIPANWKYPLADAHPDTARSGMVVTDAALASRVGVAILKQGGNAVDAAVATAFALAVAYPEAGNLGGGGFMIVRMADGRTAALDFREKAPLKASRNMYIGPDGKPTKASITGYLASGVPGSVAGLWAAHQRFGSLPWKQLLAPAIRMARDGFVVDSDFAESVRGEAERLREFDASAALFLPGGQPLVVGSTWKDPQLADVLQRIAEQGKDGFYRGKTADLLVAEMQRGGGLISHKDLEAYEAKWRTPIRFKYRGNEIISMPPPSSGGITMAETLQMLEHWDLAHMGWHSTEHLHLLTEALRRAFADRNSYLGDPDFVSIPQERLLSPAYAAQRATTIALDHATRSADVQPGLGAVSEGGNTTHFSVVDAKGDAVALTTTLNDLYGSGVTVHGAGFLLNDEMDDFAAKPGSPNMFGLVQGEVNAIAPGKRPLSSMTPTIVVGPDGRTRMVTGARGGPRIISAVIQIVSNVIDFHMDIGAAVYAPRIHDQHLPDSLYYEAGGLTPDVMSALTALGHRLAPRESYLGNAPSILRVGDVWTGIPDPRQNGLAAGY
jgi:gamma-glutamyltranspeptidase / glutathione hydrolase